jgi:hypothetical protein
MPSKRAARLPNVAVLTRESPSAARVSSAFNTKLGGALWGVAHIPSTDANVLGGVPSAGACVTVAVDEAAVD